MDGQGKGRRVKIPPIQVGAYVWDAFTRLGMAQSGMSLQPLPWAEIAAYAALSEGWVGPWESRLLHDMSVAYVSGHRDGKDPLAIPPWVARR